ncbi:uncharacterized protein K489DRAFT_385492 [Dissoconium aciculare CBS 342.82]|uniref:BTB domain-containing protein n=1 Tax=Dissoconium aciculare CBS 342.82 TaxID=1314786 RepID=A0A6J3LPD5_9PEZI|nr:uncharacterized protein K489DRAFT_385492 [Dissoconium aciculare CBS 342.82]KAF1817816.1 hypothetical protein K489DRAFT_385492 [Dissoconium aciculare CBS 342.82]
MECNEHSARVDHVPSALLITNLCPEGDAFLGLGTPQDGVLEDFQICTQTLALASPVFKKLLRGDMNEAQAILAGEKPRINLTNDDHNAMENILRVLHHCPGATGPENLDRTARIAILSDKYDCTRIFRPWLAYWLMSLELTSSPVDIGLRLLIDFTMKSSNFTETSKSAIKELSISNVESWENHELLSLLPSYLENDLISKIEDNLDWIRGTMSDAESDLGKIKKANAMKYVECLNCGRRHPAGAQKCHPCHGFSELRTLYCTSELRVAEYFVLLRQAGLWGHEAFHSSESFMDILARLESAKRGLKHQCDAGSDCPLRRQVDCILRDFHDRSNNLQGLSTAKI